MYLTWPHYIARPRTLTILCEDVFCVDNTNKTMENQTIDNNNNFIKDIITKDLSDGGRCEGKGCPQSSFWHAAE